jgi:hypothetical protein
MSYALLPRAEGSQVDIEAIAFSPGSNKLRSRLRAVIRHFSSRLVLSGLLVTFLLIAYLASYADYDELLPPYLLPSFPLDTSGYSLGELNYIKKDGVLTPPGRKTRIAKWPEDYAKQASYMEKHSRIPDVDDPWPEKPFIASTW